MQVNYLPFEGAGFILTYNNMILLGQRHKKEKDLKKDPTPEFEYIGGKVEDNETPPQTALAELTEKLGFYAENQPLIPMGLQLLGTNPCQTFLSFAFIRPFTRM